MSNADNIYDLLTSIVDDAFNIAFDKKPKTEEKDMNIFDPNDYTEPKVHDGRTEAKFTSIEAYKEQTGKRFRMTKDQKARGLTREEAFTETYGGSN